MLKFNSVNLRRGSQLLIEDFSALLYPGQKLGLVGANGSGKTSLLKLILGEIETDDGEIEYPDGLRLSYLAQETPELEAHALDYVISGDEEFCQTRRALSLAESEDQFDQIAGLHEKMAAIDGYSATSRAEILLTGLGFKITDFHLPVSQFSGGWRIRLNLAKCLMTPSELMLLDEPTNHLDLDAIIWLSNWLRKYQGSLILISHDREFIDETVDLIAHLENRKVQLYKGNYSAFEKQKAARLALQQASYVKQQAEISKMEDFVRRFRAKASKARQAQSRLKALQKLEIISQAHVDSPFSFKITCSDKVSNPLLELYKADLGYDKTVLGNVTLSLRPGDRIGLLGANGAGKSTLVKTLAKEISLLSGDRKEGTHLKVGYFSQQRLEMLDPLSSPLRHIQKLNEKLSERQIRNYLGGFDFRGDKALEAVHSFSGGEKARLSLAILTYHQPNLLLLDEPTNHLDIEMRQALTRALQSFEGAMLLVSHDRHLINNTVDQFLSVKDGKVEIYDGDLSDYNQSVVEFAPLNAIEKKDKTLNRKKQSNRNDIRSLKSSLASLEKRMDRFNRKLAEVEEKLSDPELYKDGSSDELQPLLRDQISIKQEISKTEEEWLTASERLEGL